MHLQVVFKLDMPISCDKAHGHFEILTMYALIVSSLCPPTQCCSLPDVLISWTSGHLCRHDFDSKYNIGEVCYSQISSALGL